MEGVLNSSIANKTKIVIYDFIALSIIYLIPTLSHIFSFPVYYLDPMRLMVFLVIIHTNKKNSYIIAATLPLVSFSCVKNRENGSRAALRAGPGRAARAPPRREEGVLKLV